MFDFNAIVKTSLKNLLRKNSNFTLLNDSLEPYKLPKLKITFLSQLLKIWLITFWPICQGSIFFSNNSASMTRNTLKVVSSKSAIWLIRVTLEVFSVIGTIAKQFEQILPVNYFHQKLHSRYLTVSLLRLWYKENVL